MPDSKSVIWSNIRHSWQMSKHYVLWGAVVVGSLCAALLLFKFNTLTVAQILLYAAIEVLGTLCVWNLPIERDATNGYVPDRKILWRFTWVMRVLVPAPGILLLMNWLSHTHR